MAKKKIIITGGTGFIGQALTPHLLASGYEVVVLSRHPASVKTAANASVVPWDAQTSKGWLDYVENAKAIINLAGSNIAAGRWTEKTKQRLLESRLQAGAAVVEAVTRAKKPPEVVIQAGGIGYYGSRGDELLDESTAVGTGFLTTLAPRWEASTRPVTTVNLRHVVVRLGIVLGRGGGFLSRVKLPYYFMLGGHFGSGQQWLSWIHQADVAAAILFLIEHDAASGTFNLTAPEPVTAKTFFRTLGKAMGRPAWLSIPTWPLRLVFGEMADELLLASQRALPKGLLELGYRFQFTDLETALRDLV